MTSEEIKPSQTAPLRTRDLVFDHAATLGFETMRAASDRFTEFQKFRMGLRIALDYVEIHDRRRQ